MTNLHSGRPAHPDTWVSDPVDALAPNTLFDFVKIGTAQREVLGMLTQPQRTKQLLAIVKDQGVQAFATVKGQCGAHDIAQGLYRIERTDIEDECDDSPTMYEHFVDDMLLAITFRFSPDVFGSRHIVPEAYITRSDTSITAAFMATWWIAGTKVNGQAQLGPYMKPEDAVDAFVTLWRRSQSDGDEF